MSNQPTLPHDLAHAFAVSDAHAAAIEPWDRFFTFITDQEELTRALALLGVSADAPREVVEHHHREMIEAWTPAAPRAEAPREAAEFGRVIAEICALQRQRVDLAYATARWWRRWR